MERGQIYRCKICGHVIEILHPADGKLVCCGQEMELLQAKIEDEGHEKHVPIIEKTANGVKVKVGSIPHPMEEAHYIEWIEILFDGKSDRKFLKPGEAPEAQFNVWSEDLVARAFCNIHLLWKSS